MTNNAVALSGCDKVAGCAVSIIRTGAELDAIQAEWRELFQSSPSASPPLRWEWVSNWWRIFGPRCGDGGGGLRILAIRREGHLVGILPLYEQFTGNALIGLRCLRFISTGLAEFEETCAEYLNLLYAPGEQDACMAALGPMLLNSPELSWDELSLSEMPEDSPLLQLQKSFENKGRAVRINPQSPCFITDMSDGMEKFLAALVPAASTRKNARKALRDIVTEGVVFEIASTAEQADEFFNQLVELHHRRWKEQGKSGSFAPRHAAFHRAMATELAHEGNVLLARLTHQGTPLALVYGHRVGSKFDIYQCGVPREPSVLRSPGVSVHLKLMEYLRERDVSIFDHLPGENDFKRKFAKVLCPLVSLSVSRPSLRSRAFHAASVGRRATQKCVRLLLRAGTARTDQQPSNSREAVVPPPAGHDDPNAATATKTESPL